MEEYTAIRDDRRSKKLIESVSWRQVRRSFGNYKQPGRATRRRATARRRMYRAPACYSHVLLPGRRLELSISWPAQLNDKCALKLVARGRVVRFEDGRTAMEIQQYEFRTHSPQTAVGPRMVLN